MNGPVRTKKLEYYLLVCRVVTLVFTLLVSTTTMELAFSTMNVTKTKFRNKMQDKFLMNAMMLFFEKDIVVTISMDSIINNFESLKTAEFHFHKLLHCIIIRNNDFLIYRLS